MLTLVQYVVPAVRRIQLEELSFQISDKQRKIHMF